MPRRLIPVLALVALTAFAVPATATPVAATGHVAAAKKKKAKRCVVKKRNKKGKLVPVYRTRLKKIRVSQHGKIVVYTRRVYVTHLVKVRVRRHGKWIVKKVRRRVKKTRPCKKTTGSKGKPDLPITIDFGDPSEATLDFGGFTRTVALSGQMKGIANGGFRLGFDNQLTITKGKINLAPTGIFIDDDCNDRVSDAIRTDPHTFAEIDQGSTGNTVSVDTKYVVKGLVHMHIQVALQLRNDDTGCDQPYVTTGWTDFTIPLFLKGTIAGGLQGLETDIKTSETVLDDLSACLAQGDPTLPCDGFAIPFPAIFSSKLHGVVTLGS